MIFVDTSFLLAVLDEGDQLHSCAEAWQSNVSETLVTTDYVLWELLNAFSATPNRARGHDAIAAIRSSPHWSLVRASEELLDQGLQFHQKYQDKDWSLTDCISFIVMRDRRLTRALTHDHHFEQAGFEALLRRDPP
jgi:predicted nucleic acid-binding protein